MEKLNDSSRAEFEAFMADRFNDSIDRRRCKNGDGNDYMSWDMNVARAVWQHLSQRAEAAEAKLAELAKQKSVGVARMELAIGKEGLRYYQCFVDMRPDLVLADLNTGMELFTHPAPTTDLAELAKQEPDYFLNRIESSDKWGPETELRIYESQLDASKSKDDHGGGIIELFTRPVPAVDLAELVPDEFDNWKNPASEAMRDIGYVGSKQDFTVVANWMRAAILRNIEELKK